MYDAVMTTPQPANNNIDSIRFCRSVQNKKHWILIGIPQSLFRSISVKLFISSATYISSGCSIKNKSLWVCFEAPGALLKSLASLYPAPQGYHPLFFSNSGQLLSGAALKSVLKKSPSERAEAGIIWQKTSPSEIAKASSKILC